jgi:hypothetical protein
MNPSLLMLAARQAGAFSADQARADGAHPNEIRHWVRLGWVRSGARGVLVVAGAPASRRQDAWIAYLRTGPEAALGGLFGAAVHGLRGADLAVKLLACVPENRDPAAPDIARVRRLRDWDSYDVVRVDGWPPLLSIRDCIATAAERAAAPTLLRMIQDGAHAHDLKVGELLMRAKRGYPGATRLRSAAESWIAGHDSYGERTSSDVLTAGALRPDHVNVVLVGADGRRAGPVDRYWEVGLVEELDGPDHDHPERRERDTFKDGLIRAIGAEVFRHDYRVLSDPADYLDQVRRRLDELAGAPHDRRDTIATITVEHLPGRCCVCGHQAQSA